MRLVSVCFPLTEAFVGPYQTFFAKKVQLKAVDYFRKKAPS